MNGLVEYYTDELSDWSRSLTFYKGESQGFEGKLTALEKKNSMPELAMHTERFLDLFLVQHQKFDYLQKEIEHQEFRLGQDNNLLRNNNNNPIALPIFTHQNSLRTRMQAVEKDFIRIKYNCYQFFSGFLNTKD